MTDPGMNVGMAVRMELKVCEGCGALWLRSGVNCGVYCRGCSAKLQEFPAPLGRRGPRGTRRRTRHAVGAAKLSVVAGGAR